MKRSYDCKVVIKKERNGMKISTKISGIALAAIAAVSMTAASKADSYVTAFGGANWDDVGTGLDSDTGYVIGAALGTTVKAVPGLRAELEVSYRDNNVNVFKFIEAEHSTTAVMGNLAYDLDVQFGPFRPYVMAGAGFAHTEGTIESLSLATLEASGFAWQLGAGFNAKVADGVTAHIGYRYFNAPEIEVLNYQASDGSNHAVMAGISLQLN